MSKASCTSLCLGELLYWLPLDDLVSCDDHLGNALSILDHKGFIREIDERNLYLSPIVSIDCPRTIDDSDPMPNG
jgi:hypothetical protein